MKPGALGRVREAVYVFQPNKCIPLGLLTPSDFVFVVADSTSLPGYVLILCRYGMADINRSFMNFVR